MMGERKTPADLAQYAAERSGVVVFVCSGIIIEADLWTPADGTIDAVGYPVGWRYAPRGRA